MLAGLISPGVKKGMLGSREGKIKTKMQYFSFLVHGMGQGCVLELPLRIHTCSQGQVYIGGI